MAAVLASTTGGEASSPTRDLGGGKHSFQGRSFSGPTSTIGTARTPARVEIELTEQRALFPMALSTRRLRAVVATEEGSIEKCLGDDLEADGRIGDGSIHHLQTDGWLSHLARLEVGSVALGQLILQSRRVMRNYGSKAEGFLSPSVSSRTVEGSAGPVEMAQTTSMRVVPPMKATITFGTNRSELLQTQWPYSNSLGLLVTTES